MATYHLTFLSQLHAEPQSVWRWITSLEGIQREMRPWMRMTAPRGVANLRDVEMRPGVRLFRSRLYLFCVIPFGFSDLTLLEFTDGVGFVEQSPMAGMRLWRHVRTIEPNATGCALRDELTFEPIIGGALVVWFVRRMFTHRHAMLRQQLRKM